MKALKVQAIARLACKSPGPRCISSLIFALSLAFPTALLAQFEFSTDNGTVIVKVLERQDPPAGDVATGKASLKTELVNERRNRFYASYMNKARERMKVNVNRELIAQLVA